MRLGGPEAAPSTYPVDAALLGRTHDPDHTDVDAGGAMRSPTARGMTRDRQSGGVHAGTTTAGDSVA